MVRKTDKYCNFLIYLISLLFNMFLQFVNAYCCEALVRLYYFYCVVLNIHSQNGNATENTSISTQLYSSPKRSRRELTISDQGGTLPKLSLKFLSEKYEIGKSPCSFIIILYPNVNTREYILSLLYYYGKYIVHPNSRCGRIFNAIMWHTKINHIIRYFLSLFI